MSSGTFEEDIHEALEAVKDLMTLSKGDSTSFLLFHYVERRLKALRDSPWPLTPDPGKPEAERLAIRRAELALERVQAAEGDPSLKQEIEYRFGQAVLAFSEASARGTR